MNRPINLRCATLVATVMASLVAGGCSAPASRWITDPVGPLGASVVRHWTNPQGELIVYTDREDFDDGGVMYYPHRPYRITTPEGEPVRTVRNRAGMTDQSPMTVSLEAGRYHVHAMAEGKGWVTVPVVIVANRLTVVNLEIKGLAEAEALPEAERVRLPDGRVIGRRASDP